MSDIETYNIRYEINTIAEDIILWDSVVDRMKVVNLPVYLIKYRRWSDQISSRSTDKQQIDANKVRKRRINMLGVELTQEEFEIYIKFIYAPKTATREDLKCIKSIFIKIWKGNKRYNIYDHKALHATLKNKYRQHCSLMMSPLRTRIERKLISLLMN